MDVERVTWHDAADLTVEGLGWPKGTRPYGRLPDSARGIASPRLWQMAACPAGVSIGFASDATSLHVRWTLEREPTRHGLWSLAGQAGVEAYVRDDGGPWRWCGCATPLDGGRTTEWRLVRDLPWAGGGREFRLYLPLGEAVERVEIGLPEAVEVAAVPALGNRVAIYGTSLVQGMHASHPGCAWPARLGRRLPLAVINLGFGGAGKMEREMADVIAGIDAGLHVIDCVPNMDAALIARHAAPFIAALRRARPAVPILLVDAPASA